MSEGNGQTKLGRKRKIGEAERKQIIAIVHAGGSLVDAADIVGVARRTLGLALHDDAVFCAGVKKAQKAGKLRLIKRVGTARAWQAAAWLLERKYGKEFGRKDRLDHNHRGTITLLPMRLDGDVDLDRRNGQNEDQTSTDADAVPEATAGNLLSGPVHRN